ncbi:MAG: tetratricopeptide repeat protein [Gemmatimonadota bacterium]|nr:tetratricopeptide repeat protein [Gemmatimonadota bacterium]
MLRLHTFGGCHLARDGVRLEALSGQRKGLALLALLAAAGDRGVSRDALAAYLWPESDEERARTSLRQLIHALRAQLAAPELLLASAEVRLNPDSATSDVAEFDGALRGGNEEAAVALYSGPFLEGFYLRGADDFERWTATERASLSHRFARALETLAEQASANGEARAAAEWWRRLAHAEPLSARAATGLMRALEAAGERAAALQHAQAHQLLVREEVGGAPDPSVTELAAHLRRAAAARVDVPRADAHAATGVTSPEAPAAVPASLPASPHAAAPAEAAPPARRPRARRVLLLLAAAGLLLALFGSYVLWRRPAATPSVAVLPFANTGGNLADEPLSDGLTDELIGALARVDGLRVAGRTSAFALKGHALGVRTVADTLGVAAVVDGSVRRVGRRLKVTAQLVRASDNAVLWADTYDRELTDVLDVQEEIARAIAGALRVTLVGAGDAALARRPTADPAAYELYLRGRHIFTTRTDRDAVLQAARYFEQAVARDSAYARAYAGLSDVHTRLAVFGFRRPREEYARAKAAARQALALDSTLAEAYASLAHVLCVSDFDWRGAERAFRRATELDPGYTFARVPFAICLLSEGRFADAIAQLDTARAADPLAPAVSNVLGRVYVSARQPDRAIRHLREALELSPQMDLAYQQLGHAYLQKGMHAEAIAALRQAAALSGIRDSAHLAYAYAITGQRDEARRVVRALLEQSQSRYVPPVHVAMAYAGLGDADTAFQWLERGYAEHASFMNGVNVTPAFDALRSDRRWLPLLRRMSLAP